MINCRKSILSSFSVLAALCLVACNQSNFSGSSASKPSAKPPFFVVKEGTSAKHKSGKVTIPVGETTNIADVPGIGKGKIKKISSDDPSIASVDQNGDIQAHSPGRTTIEVTYEDGSKATIKVKVPAPGEIETPLEDDTDTLGRESDKEHDSDTDFPILTPEDGFAGGYLTKPLAPDSDVAIWAVTSAGAVTWLQLAGDKVAQTKKWFGLSPQFSGSRTYVTEKGLVVARTGGYLYWIDPDNTPQGAVRQNLPNFYRLPNVAENDRVCIVSYRKNKHRYVGMGWGAGNFIEFPMDEVSPYTPQWGKVTGQTVVPNVTWGYSCFIDQERLIYYSQYGGGAVGAVDLKAMKPTDPQLAPNSKFISNNIPNATRSVSAGGSYAMNGDLAGNVFNGAGFYTLAHDRATRSVWGSAGGLLNIFPEKCLTKEPNCVGHAGFPVAQVNFNVGPLSSVGDGRMIGMVRSSPGQVILLRLKDKKDISKGIDATKLADLDGDPYMYTDYTGATLYMTRSTTNFSLKDNNSFDPTKPVRKIGFTWLVRDGVPEEWKDLKFEIRCYKDGSEPAAYETVHKVNNSKKQTIVHALSCSGKKIDQVDIRLTQLAENDTLMQIVKIQITAFQ